MKTIVFSMITFFTSVVMLSTPTFAADSTAYDPVAFGKYIKETCGDDNGSQTYKSCYSNLRNLIPGSSAADPFNQACKDEKDSLEKARAEFSKACGQFSGLSIGGSCEKAFKTCDDNGLNNYEDDEDEDDRSKKSVDRSKYASCPMPAIKDAKKATEEIKRLEDKIEGFEDRLEKSKEKVQEAKTSIETAEAERLEANNEREAKYEAETKEKGLEQTEKSKAAQKKIDEIEKAIRELEQTKNDQSVQYSVDLAKIEGICEEIAEKALSAKVTAEVNNVSKNQQKQRDLQAQLTLKSKGRTAENEAFRKREIARCRADEAKWKKPIELLNLNYQNNRIKIDAAINEMITQRTKTYTELNSTLPQEQQKEAQELQARYQKDLAMIKSKFDTKIGQCGNFQAMQQNGQPNQTQLPNGCTGLQGKLGQATANQNDLQSKLDAAEADLQYYKELLRAASSVLKDPEATDVINLTSAGGDYKSALVRVLNSCQGEDQLQANQRDVYRKSFEAAGGDLSDLVSKPISDDKAITEAITEAKEIAAGKSSTSNSKQTAPATGSKQKSGK